MMITRKIIFLALLPILSSCLVEEESLTPQGNDLSHLLGTYEGTGDLELYTAGCSSESGFSTAKVTIKGEQLNFQVSIRGNFKNCSDNTHGMSFRKYPGTSGVDFRSGNIVYRGSVNHSATTNSGSVTSYQIATNGSETPSIKYVWSCVK